MQKSAGIVKEDIMEAVIVGNTTMHHLALGLPVAGLGVYPFTPALTRPLELSAAEVGLHINECGYVVTLPLAGGFVGADTVAALLAVDPESKDGSSLIIDIGTNGEIVVAHEGRLLCASCATGPAFEGAKITHGMRAGIGAIEKVMIDPETLEASYKVIGSPGWSAPSAFHGRTGHMRVGGGGRRRRDVPCRDNRYQGRVRAGLTKPEGQDWTKVDSRSMSSRGGRRRRPGMT